MERIAYDEFSMFRDNAEEFGIPYDGPPTVRREFVEVEPGRRLSALVWGDGDPELVFLHGGAQNAHTWDTVALALGRPLVAIDLPGHGHSDAGRTGSLGIADNAADVAVVIRALALALQAVPAANAVWAGDRILRFSHSDIGVAVALEGGLITPVIRHAETKPLSAISAEMKDLTVRARAKKLKPAEYQGGAAAISNLGMYGVREFSAIINPPQATILAVGAARRQAVETNDGGIAFASMLSLTLSCDHRVVDGALGAGLLAAIKRLIEAPVTMLV